MSSHFLSPDLVQRLAFCLIHSIWQASVVAILMAILTRLVKRESAELRYLILVAGLALIPILSVLTFLSYDEMAPIVSRMTGITDSVSLRSTDFAQWTEWAVLLWMAGVACGSIRLLVSWLLSRRLLRLANIAAPAPVVELFEHLKDSLAIGRHVRLRLSARIDVPLVVGWLRPAILLPVSAITGLDANQLEAVLAHELAHIRRHDFAINILQLCVESTMFYHPAVWWLSSRVRAEREHCCDDLAVRVCGDRWIYAQALVALEEKRSGVSIIAVAASGGNLSRRIRRILGREIPYPDRLSAGIAGIVTGVWLLLSVWQSNPLIAETSPLPLPLIPIEAPRVAAPPPLVQMALLALSGESMQQAQTQSIQGTVVKMGTGEPLSGTRVGLVTIAGRPTSFMTTTSSDGTFKLSNITPGEYRLLAARSDGFLPTEYGQKGPNMPGTPVVINAGQALQTVQLTMLPPASISGRVLDQDGRPVGHARVQALKPVFGSDARALAIVESVQTNDLGEYRLFWLAPRSYFISAGREAPNTNRLQVYIQPPEDLGRRTESRPPLIIHKIQPDGTVLDVVEMPSYYPNVDDPGAARSIAVGAGDNLRGVDVHLAEPRPSRSIGGTVIDGVSGQPLNVRVQAISIEKRAYRTGGPLSPMNVNYSAMADTNGRFQMNGLVSGSYMLLVSGPPPIPAERHAHVTIDVDSKDVENVSITVPASFTLQGKVTVDGSSNFDVTKLRILVGNVLTNISPNVPFPDPDGSFTIRQLPPGDYTATVSYTVVASASQIGTNLPGEFYLKAMRVGNTDMLRDGLHLEAPPQSPLEIVIGTNPGTISGMVLNLRREPVPHSVLALIPTEKTIEKTSFLYRSTATNTAGNFVFRGIRPGNYLLYAWEAVEQAAWLDDEFMMTVQGRGTPVRVDEGGRVTVNVNVIPARN